jgi:hypothetical protein
MKVLFGDINAEVGKEDIFKPAIRNDGLYKVNNDNGVKKLYYIKKSVEYYVLIMRHAWIYLEIC